MVWIGIVLFMVFIAMIVEAVRSSQAGRETDTQWFIDHTDTNAILAPPPGDGLGDTIPIVGDADHLLGPQVLVLPEDVARRVARLMESGLDVAAVMLICDEMHCGIMEAEATAKSIAAAHPRH